MSSLKTRLRWQRHLWRRRLGWPGLAGALLLGLGLLAYAGLIIPDQMKAADLRQQANTAARTDAAPVAGATDNRQPAVYQSFPESDTASAWLEKIYDAGAAAQLNLDKGEYRLTPDPNSGLARYEINLPVRGGYVQVRQFVRTVLAELPFAALDDIQIRRGNIGEGTVEARIRFTLFLRDGET